MHLNFLKGTGAAMLVLGISSAISDAASSPSYSITCDAFTCVGGEGTGATYHQQAAGGEIASNPQVMVPGTNTVIQQGSLAQVYERSGITLSRSAVTMNESSTRTINPYVLHDDGTYLYLPPNELAWGIVSGPITSITSSGVVSSGSVYTPTTGIISGAWGGFQTTRSISVLDNLTDNWGTYAADGVSDAWQVQYFGVNNSMAAPNADPDGDGQSNHLEAAAGLNPNDPGERLHVQTQQGSGSGLQVRVGPIVAGHSYTVKFKNALGDPGWQPLSSFNAVMEGTDRVITDLSATGAARFYQVEVTGP